jgi:hypothetical protein
LGGMACSIPKAMPPSDCSPRNQVGPDLMPEAVVVVDIATAQQAINTIIDQGEGTAASPDEGVGHGFAPYYRFNEIAKGHLLVPVPCQTEPDKKFAYAGGPIALDPAGVYPVPTNPGRRRATLSIRHRPSPTITSTILTRACYASCTISSMGQPIGRRRTGRSGS